MSKEKDTTGTCTATNGTTTEEREAPRDFIRDIIDGDLLVGKHGGRVVTRFPPEPNGYLHIGHAKSICLNFGIAAEYNGPCHLRYDDTNPSKEEPEYVNSIYRDVLWLGFDPGENVFYASDYFEQFYQYAEELITKGKAYVCSLTAEEVREYRGTPTEPGTNSPYRDRSVEENLDMFRKMRAGEYPDGAHLLRAKIDMASPNLNMRDPALYRIRREYHHRTKNDWCIYPMYDFAHPLEDGIEAITHSICTLEFEDHRPLYNWVLENVTIDYHPQQIEFARLNLTYTVMSKRRLLQLVDNNLVNGWDDPRMPTLAGIRRRGYTPEAIRTFCDRIGVAKANSVVDINLLHHCVREDLNKRAPRTMAVLDPIKLIIDNYPEGQVEEMEAIINPEDPEAGTRKVPFSRELYIEREDFKEVPPPKYFRLSPGREVRLKSAYYVTCTGVEKDPDTGEIIAVHCTYDPKTRGGSSTDGRRVRGTLHWVSTSHAVQAEVRLYDHLFTEEYPGTDNFLTQVNHDSLKVLTNCFVEPPIASAKPEDFFQFERQGYFNVDRDSTPERPVFNRTIALRDTWARIARGRGKKKK